LNEQAAIASALHDQQMENTHSFYLAELLDEKCNDEKVLSALDDFFAIDQRGHRVGSSHV